MFRFEFYSFLLSLVSSPHTTIDYLRTFDCISNSPRANCFCLVISILCIHISYPIQICRKSICNSRLARYVEVSIYTVEPMINT